jgi:hypothetical protein
VLKIPESSLAFTRAYNELLEKIGLEEANETPTDPGEEKL